MKIKPEKMNGAHGEIRTHDLKIRNFALYPAELRGRYRKTDYTEIQKRKSPKFKLFQRVQKA